MNLCTIDEGNNAGQAMPAAELQDSLACQRAAHGGALHGPWSQPHPNLPLVTEKAGQIDCALP